jgi:hypothetical protein
MRIKLTTLVLSFLLGTLAVSAQEAEASGPRPFHFSSRGSGFGVQVEVEGTFLVRDDSIEVNMAEATLYVSENCPYQGRRLISHLKFGLAVGTGPNGRWKIETAGEAMPLELIMSPREEHPLYNFSTTIPLERGIDLSKRWFVVEIQIDSIDVPDGKDRRGYTYAFSCKDIFLSCASKTAQQ